MTCSKGVGGGQRVLRELFTWVWVRLKGTNIQGLATTGRYYHPWSEGARVKKEVLAEPGKSWSGEEGWGPLTGPVDTERH